MAFVVVVSFYFIFFFYIYFKRLTCSSFKPTCGEMANDEVIDFKLSNRCACRILQERRTLGITQPPRRRPLGFVCHAFKRTPKDVCGEARDHEEKSYLLGTDHQKSYGGGGWGIFVPRKFFSLSNSFINFSFRPQHEYFLGLIGVHKFFSFNFPLREYIYFLYFARRFLLRCLAAF